MPAMAYSRRARVEALEARRYFSSISGTIQTLASKGDVGQYTSVAVDPVTQRPAVAYYDATHHDLKYIFDNGKQWLASSVDTVGNVGRQASLQFDSTGTPWIAYFDATNRSLKLAHQVHGTWQTQIVDSGNTQGLYLSLALT